MSRALGRRIKRPREGEKVVLLAAPKVPASARSGYVLALLLVSLGSLGCQGRRDEFLGGRVEQACNESWPVCNQIAGCLLGTQSYVKGRIPASTRTIIHLDEPSTVAVSLFLDSVGSSGTQTTLVFYEGSCRGRTPVVVTGVEFTQEVEKLGAFARSADLTELGDHLIEFSSDAQAEYLLKIDVTPTRNTL